MIEDRIAAQYRRKMEIRQIAVRTLKIPYKRNNKYNITQRPIPKLADFNKWLW